MDTGLDATKKVVHYAGEFLGNETADTVTKSSHDEIVKEEPVWQKFIPLEKGNGRLKQIDRNIPKIIKQFKCFKACDQKNAWS